MRAEQTSLQLDGDADKGPKNLSPSQFLEQASWHATDVPDWTNEARDSGWAIHSGTPKAAAEMDRFRYHDGYAEDAATQYYPVLPKKMSSAFFEDREANAAHVLFDETHYGRPATESVHESVGAWDDDIEEVALEGMEDLSSGRTLRYDNQAEDIGSTSFISPPGGYDTLDSADLDMGLSPGYQPRSPAFSRSDMVAQGLVSNEQFAGSNKRYPQQDPRLLESSRSGKWYDGSQVTAAAQGDRHWEFMRTGADGSIRDETFVSRGLKSL